MVPECVCMSNKMVSYCFSELYLKHKCSHQCGTKISCNMLHAKISLPEIYNFCNYRGIIPIHYKSSNVTIIQAKVVERCCNIGIIATHLL